MATTQTWRSPCGICNNTNEAALHGHLECLMHAHKQKHAFCRETTGWAAIQGHLQCLKYLHFIGVAWSPSTCEDAVLNGKVACLKFAHENGAPMNSYVATLATLHSQKKCLEYIFENCRDQVPWVQTGLDELLVSGKCSPIMKQYLENVREDWIMSAENALLIKPAKT